MRIFTGEKRLKTPVAEALTTPDNRLSANNALPRVQLTGAFSNNKTKHCMAKNTELDLIEVPREKLTAFRDEAAAWHAAIDLLLEDQAAEREDADEEEEKPAKGKKAAKEEESSAAEGETELPSLKDIKKLDEDGLKELAEKLNLTVDELDEDAIRELLVTLVEISAGDEPDDDDAVKNLATAVGLKPGKKSAETITKIKEYYAIGEQDAPEDDAKEEESDDDADEKPAKGKKLLKKTEEEDEDAEEKSEASDEEDEGVDYDAAVEAVDPLPKSKVMAEQLTAFNEVADDKAIEFDAADKAEVTEAYQKLLRRLVDHEGNVAKWGDAYIRCESGWCCGLPLNDTKVKGEKRDCGECAVTGAKFAFEDGAFEALD